MALPDQNLSTLDDIRIKVRRLTRSPSQTQLFDAQIDDYVNNFVLYDFPEFVNKFTLTFYTQPNIDRYTTNTINALDPLYNFKNKFLGIDGPVFVDGEEMWLSLSRQNFLEAYPLEYRTESIATGDGVTIAYAGVFETSPALQEEVKILGVDAANAPMTYIDSPQTDPASGYNTQVGSFFAQNFNVAAPGAINYLTGVFNFTFPAAPANGSEVSVSYVSYEPSKPKSILFSNDYFTLRPIPDKAYKITLEAYFRPIELLAANSEPYLAEWWQYIAYGAAKKVFEDRMDMESIQMIAPEFNHQRLLVQRRQIIQQSINRVPTIYAWNDVNKSQSRT